MKHLVLALALSFVVLAGLAACTPNPNSAPYTAGQSVKPN